MCISLVINTLQYDARYTQCQIVKRLSCGEFQGTIHCHCYADTIIRVKYFFQLQFCCQDLPSVFKDSVPAKYLSLYTNSRFHDEFMHCYFQLTISHGRRGISGASFSVARRVLLDQFRVTQLVE